jgi:hypothetical protein
VIQTVVLLTQIMLMTRMQKPLLSKFSHLDTLPMYPILQRLPKVIQAFDHNRQHHKQTGGGNACDMMKENFEWKVLPLLVVEESSLSRKCCWKRAMPLQSKDRASHYMVPARSNLSRFLFYAVFMRIRAACAPERMLSFCRDSLSQVVKHSLGTELGRTRCSTPTLEKNTCRAQDGFDGKNNLAKLNPAIYRTSWPRQS